MLKATMMISAVPVRSSGRWLNASANPRPITVPGIASGRLATKSSAPRPGSVRPRDEVGDQHAEDGGDDRGHDAQADRVDQGVARARQHRREMSQREGVVDTEEPRRRTGKHGQRTASG